MKQLRGFLYSVMFLLLLCMAETARGDWGSWLGGAGVDGASAIAVDGGGYVYIAGTTSSAGWTSGGYDTTFGGESDIYVVKLSSSGQHVWSTYLGGSGSEHMMGGLGGISLDAAGNVYVTGNSFSPWSEGWISGGYQEWSYGDGGFLVKLSPAGAHLWSTYVGCGVVTAPCVDSGGNVYVPGMTGCASYSWTAGGYDETYGGGTDGFIVKVSSSGAHLWSTYVGGSGIDSVTSLVVGGSGDVHATGMTNSSDWISGGSQTTPSGGRDAFALKVSSAGAHIWSTYAGGAGDDFGADIAVDSAGNVFITGDIQTAGATLNGSPMAIYDGYVAAMSPTSAPLWMTFLSGIRAFSGRGIAADHLDNLYIVGEGDFLLKLSNTGVNLGAVYFPAAPHAVTVDAQGYVHAAGQAAPPDSEWISGGWDVTHNGSNDGFAVKFMETSGEGAEICVIGLDGSQAAPPTGSPAIGVATFSAMPNAMVKLRIEHDIQNPTGASINFDDIDIEYINLQNATSPIEYYFTAQDYELLPGNYIVVKSAAYPQGEIRGRIECGCAHTCPDLSGSGQTLYAAPLLNEFVATYEIQPLDWSATNPIVSTPDLDGSFQVVIGRWEETGKIERWERWERWEKSSSPRGGEKITLTGGDFNMYDSWEIALFEELLCSPFSHPLKTAACDAYTYNLNLLPTDNPLLVAELQAAGALPFVAAAMAMSTDWRETFRVMGLWNQYQTVTSASKTGFNEPFAPSGDLDGDGVSNQEAFDQTIALGGAMGDFVQSATQNLEFDDPMAGMPVSSGLGVAVLVGVLFTIGSSAAYHRRKRL